MDKLATASRPRKLTEKLPSGSTVLIVGDEEGTTLVRGFLFWALALFGAGVAVGWQRPAQKWFGAPTGKQR